MSNNMYNLFIWLGWLLPRRMKSKAYGFGSDRGRTCASLYVCVCVCAMSALEQQRNKQALVNEHLKIFLVVCD